MAVIDHVTLERERSAREAFEKFKEHLKAKALEGDNISIRMVIEDMEETIENQSKRIKEYEDYFNTLYRFLPHQHPTTTQY